MLFCCSTTISNIRGNVVSRAHPYEDLLYVTLQDEQTLVISYVNDHDYVYISPVSPFVVLFLHNVGLVCASFLCAGGLHTCLWLFWC